MANPSNETVLYPFAAFNFEVKIKLPGESDPLCSAAFAECDGLEMSIEAKTIREGGNNNNQIRLIGAVTYGQLTLKRGMTANFDLWRWFDLSLQPGKGGTRASVEVFVLNSNREAQNDRIRAQFNLTRCLPLKLKAPALNAKDGNIAIEEMQIAYERLEMSPNPTARR
jgi:phage tail-like protein